MCTRIWWVRPVSSRASTNVQVRNRSSTRKCVTARRPRPGGVIAIDSVKIPTGGVALRVTDTGIGIPGEAVDKLFQPFSQVDSAYSRKHDGVGLGLSICRSIMKAYGGSISLESQVDMGTMVTLKFPESRLVTVEPEAEERPRAAE